MKAIPDGFHTLTPHLFLDGAEKAIALYEKALGAQKLHVMHVPGTDRVMHAMILVGNSPVFLADASPEGPAKSGETHFYVYVEDVDAAFARAVEAGLTAGQAPTDMFWGDRMGGTVDPYGIHWTFATHTRDVSPEEMQKAMAAMAQG